MATEISEYQQQAIDFLKTTKTTFDTKFLRFGVMGSFNDDTERNIFEVTLKNAKGSFSFEFGSSLHDSLLNSDNVIHNKEIDFYYGWSIATGNPKYLSYSDKINIKKLKAAFEAGEFSTLLNMGKAEKLYTKFISDNDKNKKIYNKMGNIPPMERWLSDLEKSLLTKCKKLSEINWGKAIQAESIVHPDAYTVLSCLTKYEPGTFENFCGDYGYDEDSRRAEKIYEAVKKEYEELSKLFTDDELELMAEIQ